MPELCPCVMRVKMKILGHVYHGIRVASRITTRVLHIIRVSLLHQRALVFVLETDNSFSFHVEYFSRKCSEKTIKDELEAWARMVVSKNNLYEKHPVWYTDMTKGYPNVSKT